MNHLLSINWLTQTFDKSYLTDNSTPNYLSDSESLEDICSMPFVMKRMIIIECLCAGHFSSGLLIPSSSSTLLGGTGPKGLGILMVVTVDYGVRMLRIES